MHFWSAKQTRPTPLGGTCPLALASNLVMRCEIPRMLQHLCESLVLTATRQLSVFLFVATTEHFHANPASVLLWGPQGLGPSRKREAS